MFSDKIVYSLHRISGLVGGLFILILTVTGSILVVDQQVDNLLTPNQTHIESVGQLQSVGQLLATVNRQYPEAKVRSLTLWDSTKKEAVRVDLSDKGIRTWVAMNPYTGAIIGARQADATLIRRTRELHENLLVKPIGGYIMGLAGICLLVSVLTGTWYYRRALLSVFKIGVRWNKSPRIVYADIHKWLGVVALLFMLMMSATGIFFHWEQIERAFGEGKKVEPAQVAPISLTSIPVDAAIAAARASIADFHPQLIDFPKPGDSTLVIRGNKPESIRMLGKYNVAATIDARNGHYLSGFDARDADLEYIAEHIFEELHFGHYGGWISQIIYILLALSTAVVTLTGLFLWLLKR
ncbi:PepSY-associated TM helix domain-containing protein [Spirosoma radiotolerans]|uniref:PepSY-associated TM helix domain-containing protein n=1 Tax=Spirosoma radiotolerans TaxID=1379870 RepID=A0A0E3V6Y4_9BACT|nr:PepSY-associated TM helix domain-containing protein [Spirosoma radiotolerans]AKD54956.1 PepSY-associated TM helix domain-containing protein [Spirosoma radiotolerans]